MTLGIILLILSPLLVLYHQSGSRNTSPQLRKLSFDAIDNRRDLSRYVMQQKWDIHTWDHSHNKWRNHGHLVKLPPNKLIIKSELEHHIRYMRNRPGNYFHNQDEDIILCRDNISLGDAVKEYTTMQRNDPDPYNRTTIWDIFADKYKFYEIADGIQLTDFCDDSDAVFTLIGESALDDTDFGHIPKKSSTKKFHGNGYPSDYFSNPDTISGELIWFKGVVFRKSNGKIFMNSCVFGEICLPNY